VRRRRRSQSCAIGERQEGPPDVLNLPAARGARAAAAPAGLPLGRARLQPRRWASAPPDTPRPSASGSAVSAALRWRSCVAEPLKGRPTRTTPGRARLQPSAPPDTPRPSASGSAVSAALRWRACVVAPLKGRPTRTTPIRARLQPRRWASAPPDTPRPSASGSAVSAALRWRSCVAEPLKGRPTRTTPGRARLQPCRRASAPRAWAWVAPTAATAVPPTATVRAAADTPRDGSVPE
jgi:hypothetical protein